MQRLAVLVGVSGSGKSTWVAAHPEFKRVTFDAIRKDGRPVGPLIAATRKRARRLAFEGVSLAGDACNLKKSHRAWWWNLAREVSASAVLVLVHPPGLSVLEARQADRGGEAVPADVLRRQFGEWPAALAAARRERWDETIEVGAPCLTTSRRW